MAAKAFGPMWGLFYPLHHGACVVGVLCTPTLRNSSPDDLGPLWDTARSLSLLLLWSCLGSLVVGVFLLNALSPAFTSA